MKLFENSYHLAALSNLLRAMLLGLHNKIKNITSLEKKLALESTCTGGHSFPVSLPRRNCLEVEVLVFGVCRVLDVLHGIEHFTLRLEQTC